MKVLFVAAESAPFIKTGGLGDVIGSLPKALKNKGIDARVVLPLYSKIDKKKYNIKFVKYIYVSLGWKNIYCGIFKTEYKGVKYYFIDNEQYFNRNSVYGQFDDAERFAFFSKASIMIMPHIEFKADIINVNDWHTAMSIIYLDKLKKDNDSYYIDMKSVLSIHNIEFQGKYDKYLLGDVFGLGNEYLNVLTFGDCLNLMKGGIQLADRVNTVSETYSKEILNSFFSFGLDPILNIENHKIRGIVNGIDYEIFDPEEDQSIYKRYNKKSINDKYKNKLALQKELCLEENIEIPLIGMVTRLTDQKGIGLITEVAEQILNMGTQLVILGTGDPKYEEQLRHMENMRHDRMRSIIMFSNQMSSKIYAAADLYIMPSKSEPCGLSQLIAMRYGTIPVVHRVGGLRDTVEPFNIENGTGCGFTFESFNAYDMLDAIKRALDVFYYEKKAWKLLINNAMSYNSKWEKSAKKYIEMYKEIL
ncbi:glycogen synthase GlgA [Peptostreptococcus canis]|uniref:Glycogen synthase n=1 Tax=Peptostreptococcus canis TaxID=1159213 RepID=A0ABR6TN14_9FIRM|nr:glycogen synthase GlgA [Peptostreptococcus canis]MBC2576810.1 glycogen synthase GlgA [Peptostreptococcus canis]MBP1998880.1 starch synthase [Peptostreptococcus canis]